MAPQIVQSEYQSTVGKYNWKTCLQEHRHHISNIPSIINNEYFIPKQYCYNASLQGKYSMETGLLWCLQNVSQYHIVRYTVGPVLIAWFNYCVLSFATKIANLLIAFASYEACEVRYK